MSKALEKLEKQSLQKNREVFLVSQWLKPIDLLLRNRNSGLPVAAIKISDETPNVEEFASQANLLVPGVPTVAILSASAWKQGQLDWVEVLSK